jgi:hypothetical protein
MKEAPISPCPSNGKKKELKKWNLKTRKIINK